VNLAALRSAHGDRFYPQNWMAGEAFMLREPAPYHGLPGEFIPTKSAEYSNFLPSAATLAQLWVDHPELDIWKKYIWTGDRDSNGQQVYVGVNNGKFEIHRHLHLTDRWGVLIW
jgi:hypothetical protein